MARWMSFALKPWPLPAGEGVRIVTRRSKRLPGHWLCEQCPGQRIQDDVGHRLEHGAQGFIPAMHFHAARWAPAWTHLKPGDLIRAVEWSPRAGARWVCPECGHKGGKSLDAGMDQPCPAGGGVMIYRGPERGDIWRLVSIRSERLFALRELSPDELAAEMALELFPGKSADEFIDLYTGGKGDDRPCSRMELEWHSKGRP